MIDQHHGYSRNEMTMKWNSGPSWSKRKKMASKRPTFFKDPCKTYEQPFIMSLWLNNISMGLSIIIWIGDESISVRLHSVSKWLLHTLRSTSLLPTYGLLVSPCSSMPHNSFNPPMNKSFHWLPKLFPPLAVTSRPCPLLPIFMPSWALWRSSLPFTTLVLLMIAICPSCACLSSVVLSSASWRRSFSSEGAPLLG